MPTGTGKTETTLSTMAACACKPVLVIVPSDALRSQTARKFLSFGLLRRLGVLLDGAPNPYVGVITKVPKKAKDLEIFERSNVVIATMSALADAPAVPECRGEEARSAKCVLRDVYRRGRETGARPLGKGRLRQIQSQRHRLVGGGRQITIGCSFKGRVWSREQASIPSFTEWCETVGDKLLDGSIDTSKLIDDMLIPNEVFALPAADPFSIEWPLEMLRQAEERVTGARRSALYREWL